MLEHDCRDVLPITHGLATNSQSAFPIHPKCVHWGSGQGVCEGHSNSSTPENHFFIDFCAHGHHAGTEKGPILVQMILLRYQVGTEI